MKIQKRTLCASTTALVAIALVAMVFFPTIAASTQSDYTYALNPQNWAAEEPGGDMQAALASQITARIEARGSAFQRVSVDTIQQYNCTTEIYVMVTPATDTSGRTVGINGSVTVNGSTYTITGGNAFLAKDKKIVYLNCTGTDGNGNEVTLKLAAHYFWWYGHAYALRSKALLGTADGMMLLLQRGIAKIS